MRSPRMPQHRHRPPRRPPGGMPAQQMPPHQRIPGQRPRDHPRRDRERGPAQPDRPPHLHQVHTGGGVGLVYARRREPGPYTGHGEAVAEASVARHVRPRLRGQLGQLDLPARSQGQRMVLGQHHVHRIPRHLHPGQPPRLGRRALPADPDQREVQAPVGDAPGDLPLGPGGVRGHRYAGLLVGEPVHEPAEQRPVRPAEPVPLRPLPGEPQGLLLQLAHRGQQDPRPLQHELPERGGPYALPPADEQRPAQRPLDPLQLRTERGLCEAERGGGPGQAPGVGDGPDDLEVPQLQIHTTSLVQTCGRALRVGRIQNRSCSLAARGTQP